jgi:hypothetical protein
MLDRSHFSVKLSTFEDLLTTEIPVENDTSRGLEYALEMMGPESLNIE